MAIILFSWLGEVKVDNIMPYWLLSFFAKFYSYEDWGVDELIVEDSWKRQVGGDWWLNWQVWGGVTGPKFLSPRNIYLWIVWGWYWSMIPPTVKLGLQRCLWMFITCAFKLSIISISACLYISGLAIVFVVVCEINYQDTLSSTKIGVILYTVHWLSSEPVSLLLLCFMEIFWKYY